jgi:hypothetical protein
MGKAMDQGFEEETVLDMDHFIVMEGYVQILKTVGGPLFFQFVAPDITFIKHRIVDDAFA